MTERSTTSGFSSPGTTLVHALITGEGPQFTRTAEEVEGQAEHCNKKKKAAKIVQVGSPNTNLSQCML